MPTLLVALPAGLMAGMRRRFDPVKAFGGPIAFIVMVWFVSTIVTLFQPMQFVLVFLMGILYFLGFYLLQKTGNPFGMLLVIVTALISIMGMSSIPAMRIMRDGFTEACIVAAILIPLVYAVFPPATGERMVEQYVPSPSPHALSALIRTAVLLGSVSRSTRSSTRPTSFWRSHPSSCLPFRRAKHSLPRLGSEALRPSSAPS